MKLVHRWDAIEGWHLAVQVMVGALCCWLAVQLTTGAQTIILCTLYLVSALFCEEAHRWYRRWETEIGDHIATLQRFNKFLGTSSELERQRLQLLQSLLDDGDRDVTHPIYHH